MSEIIIKTFITFFCMYGFTEFLRTLLSFFISKDNCYDDFVLVIKVKNSEKTLEGTIRMLVWKALSAAHGGSIPKILIVDMGSDDSTADIAQRLCRDYSFVDYVTYEEYLKKKEE